MKLYTPGETIVIPNITDEKGTDGIKALEYYKQRMLSMLDNEDISIMPENTEKYNKILYEIYKELQIPFINPENIIYTGYNGSLTSSILDEFDKLYLKNFLKTKNIKYIFPFIHSNKIDEIRKIFSLQTSRNNLESEIINNKAIAQSELRDLGVLTPQGKVVYSEKQAQDFFLKLKSEGYEFVTLKLKRAASGMGVYKIKTLEELEKKLFEHKDELKKDGLLIDGWIMGKFIDSPNIQYFVGENKKDDVFIGCSSQILSEDGTVHLGNISNPLILQNKKLKKDLEIIRDWVRGKKAYGVIGIDFVIMEDENQEQKAYFMEINGRVNGSTHGPIIVNKIYGRNNENIGWAVVNNIYLNKKTSIDDFISALQRDGLFYDPYKKTGVIPTNISAIENYSKAMVIILGDNSFIKEAIKTLQNYNK